MKTTPKYTARGVLEAFYDAEREYMSAAPEDRNYDRLAATMSPTIRMEQTSALPYAGTYIGHEGMQEWARVMAEYFEVVDIQKPEIFESPGSSRVVVLSTVHFKVRSTGEELYFPFCQAVTVDLEQGVMTELRPFHWDVAAVNKALGHGQ